LKKTAIITGGGSGQRMGSGIPKQFLLLNGKPVIFHTIEKFSGLCDDIIVVLPKEHFEFFEKHRQEFGSHLKVTLVAGGSTRIESVTNALNTLSGDVVVAVHDAVRPLVSRRLITSAFETAEEKGSAVPVVRLRESIRQLNGSSSKAVNRELFVVVQTPQCFHAEPLKKAYAKPEVAGFTDDASVYEHNGNSIQLIDGEENNIKITYPGDIEIAASLLKAESA